ncbi:MAG: Na-translocating system protein MpsC family protein [Desulfocucumaceae bacterium]
MSLLAQLEAEICEAFIKFQRELTGRGPEATRAFILKDMIIVRSKGVLTRQEMHVAATRRGRSLVKQMRQELRETYLEKIEEIITGIVGSRVVSSHGDISIRTGDALEVFIVDCDLQKKFI